MIHDMIFISAVSPLHCGAGEGLGIIDRPVMRERTTNFPIIPGSTLKGVLRDEYASIGKSVVDALFGPMDDGSKYAGCVSFSDAALFAFPIRSLKGSFVWATSALVLYRLQRIIEVAGLEASFPNLKNLLAKRELSSESTRVLINPDAKSTLLIDAPAASGGSKILLEEFSLPNADLPGLKEFASEISTFIFGAGSAFATEFTQKLVVLPEDRFNYFVTYATEVVPNIKIDDETGTSKEGLRYSEYLPTETVLYCLASFDKTLAAGASKELDQDKKVKAFLVTEKPKKVIQIGADGTKGKGFVKINFVSEVAKK